MADQSKSKNTLDDLGVRIATIEDRLANLRVEDLPMTQLQRKLEWDWHPNGAALLESKSITADQLTGDVVDYRTLGPLTGNGVAFGSSYNLPGFSLSYTVDRPRKVRVDYQARFDATTTVWNWCYTRLGISGPAAAFRLKTGATGNSDLRSYYAGASWNMNQGWDYWELSTPGSYTFYLQAQSSAGQVVWSATAENYMMLTATPL